MVFCNSSSARPVCCFTADMAVAISLISSPKLFLYIFKRVSSNPSTSASAAPVCVITVFNAWSQSVSNFVAYVAAATNPAPRAVAAFFAASVKPSSFSSRDAAFSLASSRSFPDNSAFFPSCAMAVSVCFAASSKSANSRLVFSTSRFKARYCASETSPFLNCSCTWLSAVFRMSNFSLVSEMASFKRFCFCVRASVLVGSIFKSLLTSLSSAWVFRTCLLTPPRALSSFVVSPPISMVIPFMLLAIY